MSYLERIIESSFGADDIHTNKDSTINVKYCPWCDEYRWKLNINPNKGRYGVFRCAKCGAAGDVIALQAKMRGLDYKEAKRELDGTNLPSNFSYEVTAKSEQLPTASLRRRDLIYRGLIAHGYQSNRMAKDLEKRGLTSSQFEWYIHTSADLKNKLNGYADVKNVGLIENGHTVGVPGVFGKVKKDQFGREITDELYFSFPLNPGYLIPIISHIGYSPAISCMQIRHFEVEEGYPRYSYFSSNNSKLSNGIGVGGCNKVHYTRNFWNKDLWTKPEMKVPEVVNLTEGALKADVASVLSGRCFIAVPGVNNVRDLSQELKFLKENGCKAINLCFDMDYQTKPQVEKALKNVKKIIKNSGLIPRMITWDATYKGIDDYYLHLKKSQKGGNKHDGEIFQNKF